MASKPEIEPDKINIKPRYEAASSFSARVLAISKPAQVIITPLPSMPMLPTNLFKKLLAENTKASERVSVFFCSSSTMSENIDAINIQNPLQRKFWTNALRQNSHHKKLKAPRPVGGKISVP